MIELDEQLRRLADSVETPGTAAEEDLARGRARLRHRNLGVAAVAATTAALIGTTAVLLSGGSPHQGASPDFAGSVGPSAAPSQVTNTQQEQAARAAAEMAMRAEHAQAAATRLPDVLKNLAEARSPRIQAVLSGYRDDLREDLDPSGRHIQSGPITNEQGGSDSLGTKLTWNGGGMLEISVGRSLESVQFFCDGACSERPVAGGTKALVQTSPGRISVAVFQDDGDVVALTADTSFGNNGTSTATLGLTVDQLLAAAADARINLPPAG